MPKKTILKHIKSLLTAASSKKATPDRKDASPAEQHHLNLLLLQDVLLTIDLTSDRNKLPQAVIETLQIPTVIRNLLHRLDTPTAVDYDAKHIDSCVIECAYGLRYAIEDGMELTAKTACTGLTAAADFLFEPIRGNDALLNAKNHYAATLHRLLTCEAQFDRYYLSMKKMDQRLTLLHSEISAKRKNLKEKMSSDKYQPVLQELRIAANGSHLSAEAYKELSPEAKELYDEYEEVSRLYAALCQNNEQIQSTLSQAEKQKEHIVLLWDSLVTARNAITVSSPEETNEPNHSHPKEQCRKSDLSKAEQIQLKKLAFSYEMGWKYDREQEQDSAPAVEPDLAEIRQMIDQLEEKLQVKPFEAE